MDTGDGRQTTVLGVDPNGRIGEQPESNLGATAEKVGGESKGTHDSTSAQDQEPSTALQEHSDPAAYYHNLGVSHAYKYLDEDDLEELELGLKYSQAAVDATPVGHPELAVRQYDLGLTYSARFGKLGKMDDLESAMKYTQAAVDATPTGSPDFARYQWSLAMVFRDRFRKLGNSRDHESARRCNQAAIDATPVGHPDLAGYQHSLAALSTERSVTPGYRYVQSGW